MSLTTLEPVIVFNHFTAINAIPRASTKEEEIIAYMLDFGKSLQLETSVDKTGNVLIKKPATPGKEDRKTAVLQGHLDMVHQKTADSDFDFATQGIEMYVDGDWVKAKETTLGADNGIGVAAIMAILSATDIEHPRIEAIFTIDEETGMTGALALEKHQLSGAVLLNLDSEEDDEITIGCAGGVDVEIDGAYETKTLDEDDYYRFFELTVGGLKGGHSGVEIHLNRANANVVLVQLLQQLVTKLDVRIATMKGGGLTNVIPRDATAIIAVAKNERSVFSAAMEKLTQATQKAYGKTDASLAISHRETPTTFPVMNSVNQKQILQSMTTIPNGVLKMTAGMDDLVQTSNNLAKIELKEGKYRIACHARSSIDAERNGIVAEIRTHFPHAKVVAEGPYPSWEPRPDSEILKIAKNCYRELHGVEPLVKSIHAGLECGILSGTFPNMEMISFGPNILGAHSPEERLQISSTQKFWSFLTRILEEI